MSELYFCTKCGKPLERYNDENINAEVCINCCRAHEKLPVPVKYITYIAGVVPTLNSSLEEDFFNTVVKRNPNFEQSLSWYEHKEDLYEHNNQQYEKIKAFQEDQASAPKCPTCQSANIKKISAASKITNTALFGLLGTKRYKTFHCNNCGYEW